MAITSSLESPIYVSKVSWGCITPDPLCLSIPYPPENKPPPPFSAVDMAQTGGGASFRICAMRLEYNTLLDIYGVYSPFEPRTQQQELALRSSGQLYDTSQTNRL